MSIEWALLFQELLGGGEREENNIASSARVDSWLHSFLMVNIWKKVSCHPEM